MSKNLQSILQKLPKEDRSDYRSGNSLLFSEMNKACIVIDDDPTGNQTVYGIPLLSGWEVGHFVEEFKAGTPVFFILTNSRSLTPQKTSEIYKEIAKNILKASEITKRNFTIISRSDSTLRGHFPLEPQTLKINLTLESATTVFLPVMFEGNRITLNDIHYIHEGNELIPVNETPFSEDHSFKYSKSNLKEYIEEKSNGEVKASDVLSFSIEDVRNIDVKVLAEHICLIPPKSYCIFNSLNYNDLNKVSQALLLAEKQGKQMIYRTSSSFVPSYIGLSPRGLLTSKEVFTDSSLHGGVIIVGSYVKKSSEQLHNALSIFNPESIIEVEVAKVLSKKTNYIEDILKTIDDTILKGEDVIVYTSRKLVTGSDVPANVDIAGRISNALVDIVKGITVKPKYLIAKGGITSHDIATKGLGMKRSKVLGQVHPGIPLWKMGSETRFPKLPYIVFPGNVGNAETLQKIITKLKNHD